MNSTTILADSAAGVVKKFYETADDNSTGVEALDAFFAMDFKDHNRSPNVPAEVSDRDGMLGLFAEIGQGIPDAAHSLEILENLDDDRAVVYWAFTGTHTGTFFGSPATGNAININGIDIFRVKDGKFVETWHVEELMTLFQQVASAS